MDYPGFIDALSLQYNSTMYELDYYLENYDDPSVQNTDPDLNQKITEYSALRINEHVISHGIFAALYLLCVISCLSLLKKRFQSLMTLKAALLTISSLLGLSHILILKVRSTSYSYFVDHVQTMKSEESQFKFFLDKNEIMKKSMKEGVDIHLHLFILPYVSRALKCLVDFLFHFDQVVSVILMQNLRRMTCELQANENKGLAIILSITGVVTFIITSIVHIIQHIFSKSLIAKYISQTDVLKPFDFVFTLVCCILVFFYTFHVLKSLWASKKFRQTYSSQKPTKLYFLEIYTAGLCLIFSFKTIFLLVRLVLTILYFTSCVPARNMDLSDLAEYDQCYSKMTRGLNSFWSLDLNNIGMIHWATLCELVMVLIPPLKRLITKS